MRQIRMSGSMSGEWNRSMVGYSGTGTRKSRQHARPHLNHRATPRLYFVTLWVSGALLRCHDRHTPLFHNAHDVTRIGPELNQAGSQLLSY